MPGILDALLIGASAIKDVIPWLEDEATVEVVGQPGANRRDLYFLAVSAVSSLVRRFGPLPSLLPPTGLIMIEYDAADNWVRCTQRYKTNVLEGAIGAAGGAGLLGLLVPGAGGLGRAVIGAVTTLPVFQGPEPQLIGGDWNFTGAAALPGGVSLAPKLPFNDKVILTTDIHAIDPNPAGSGGEVPPTNLNPKPPGDYRSRGALVYSAVLDEASGFRPGAWSGDLVANTLLPLVYSALSNPSSRNQETFPPATSTGG